MRSLAALLGVLPACAHPSRAAPVPVARASTSVAAVDATAEPDVLEPLHPSLYKLPDYHPMQSFLEKTSPPDEPPRVYVTLTPTEAPMSLERRAIETVALSCFGGALDRAGANVTLTLDTRADGTIANGSIDGTSMSIGSCLIRRLASVPIHEEGRPQHVVIVLGVSFG